MRVKICFLFLFILTISCQEKKEETNKSEIVEPVLTLPFQKLSFNDLTEFKTIASKNWSVAGSVYVDRSKRQMLTSEEGKGILVNNLTEDKNENLFTNFEHGDIELEMEVMMPKESNSGLYFQGRYEIQLYDSWGVKEPQHSDLGGIYERWDSIRGKGKEGFDGVAPKLNAAKAPGLWQRIKILFHAPRFDSTGIKIKNASFEKVWLNGMLIQENVELSGPTRAAAFEDEKPLGPLMIQGDHGPVAFKNLKYKRYENKKISLSDISMSEFENKEVLLPNLDSLVTNRTISADSISANMVSDYRSQSILKYEGKMNVPDSGDYLFDYKINVGGGLLLIDGDTIVDMNGENNLDSLGLGIATLQKGTVPFTLIYNKFIPWRIGFSLDVEGPEMQKHSLHAPKSLDLSRGKPDESIMVNIGEEPVAQRSFLMHDGVKRTHCISVGTPQKIHYAYDLESGSLLKVWSGEFLDATKMWHQRGEKQLGEPAGFMVSFHGDPEFAILENENSPWPETTPLQQGGYEFDNIGNPVFTAHLGGCKILDKMIPSKTLRMLHRTIEVYGEEIVWHKVAEGESIKKLADGSYIVNDESYFIDFSDSNEMEVLVRKKGDADELLVKILAGEELLEYSIIW